MRAAILVAALLATSVPAASQSVSDSAPDAAEAARQERMEKSWKHRSGQAIRSVCADCRGGSARRPSATRAEVEPEPALPDLREERLTLPEDRLPLLRWFGAR
jgi:hypothetical protein